MATTEPGAHRRFDAFELAAAGAALAGEIDARSLPRAAKVLSAGSEPVPMAWQIRGGHDAAGRPLVTVRLDGAVPLVCQRCLRPFAAKVAQQTDLLLARDEAELVRLDEEESEVVLADTMLDPRQLVEDELLLSLPLSPRHGDDECAAAMRAGTDEGRRSPFAGLAALKRRDPG